MPLENEFDDLGEGHTTKPVVRSEGPDAREFEPGSTAAKRPAETPALGLPKLTTIILEEGEHIPPGGQPIGHNGNFYLLKPGVEQAVPDHLLNILDDAIIEKPIVSQDGYKIVGQRKMLRFPYRVVRS